MHSFLHISCISNACRCSSGFLLPICKIDGPFLLSDKTFILLFLKLPTLLISTGLTASTSRQVELFIFSCQLQSPTTVEFLNIPLTVC